MLLLPVSLCPAWNQPPALTFLRQPGRSKVGHRVTIAQHAMTKVYGLLFHQNAVTVTKCRSVHACCASHQLFCCAAPAKEAADASVYAGTPVVRKTPSFRDSAMETASVDTAYQPSSSQHGHSQYAPSASPSSASRRPRRQSDAGPPPQIRIDIPPTPTVPPSAASSYDSTYHASQAPLEAPPEASQPSAEGTALSAQAGKLQPSSASQPAAGSQQPTTPNPISAAQPRQQTDARAQSPLGGLMGQLGSQSPDAASPVHTEDLLAWLETKDRQVAPPLHLGVAQAFRQPSATLAEEPVFKHQEAAEVCLLPLVASCIICSKACAVCNAKDYLLSDRHVHEVVPTDSPLVTHSHEQIIALLLMDPPDVLGILLWHHVST